MIEHDGNLEKEEECVESEVTSHKFFYLALAFNFLQMQNFPLYVVSKKVAFSYFPN